MSEYNRPRKKKYYPSKRKKYYPKKYHRNNNKPSISLDGFFDGNYGQNLKLGGNNHDVSAYVEKTIYIRDSSGNVKKAKQRFFLNSGQHIGRVRVNDDEGADF